MPDREDRFIAKEVTVLSTDFMQIRRVRVLSRLAMLEQALKSNQLDGMDQVVLEIKALTGPLVLMDETQGRLDNALAAYKDLSS